MLDINEMVICMYCNKKIKTYLAYRATKNDILKKYMCHVCNANKRHKFLTKQGVSNHFPKEVNAFNSYLGI